jgi:hypothetical protein
MELTTTMVVWVSAILILLGILSPIFLRFRFGSYADNKKALFADIVLSVIAVLAGLLGIFKSGVFIVSDLVMLTITLTFWLIVALLFPFSLRYGRWSKWSKRN